MKPFTQKIITICSTLSFLMVIFFPLICFAEIDFILIDAVGNRAIRSLQNNETIFLNETGSRLNIRVDVANSNAIGRVRFILDNRSPHDESYPPFALAGDVKGNYKNWTPSIGFHTLQAIAYDTNGHYVEEQTIGFSVLTSRNILLMLVNATTNTDIKELEDNDRIDLSKVGRSINIRVEPQGISTIGNIRFILDKEPSIDDNYPPYVLAGNTDGDYPPWPPAIGDHTLSILVYDSELNLYNQRTLSFTIFNSDEENQEEERNQDTNPVIHSQYNRNKDLISLHFDQCADPDDGHATVADKVILSYFGLNAHVVTGTYGYQPGPYQQASERVMTATWGNNGWLNAHSHWNDSVAKTEEAWRFILANGGHVWIAEGGQSDFTAEVVRRLRRNYSAETTKARIHLVQHSEWNEKYTRNNNLSYVKNNTHYIKIADGNQKENGTAGLLERPGETAGHRQIENFIQLAENSIFSTIWNAAFSYLSPRNEKLDFSDSVELLHILGIATNDVSDCSEFADMFLSR